MILIEIISPAREDVVSPPIKLILYSSQAKLIPWYNSLRASILNLLLTAILTKTAIGVEYIAHISETFTAIDL